MFEVSKIIYLLQGIEWYQFQSNTSTLTGQKVNFKIFPPDFFKKTGQLSFDIFFQPNQKQTTPLESLSWTDKSLKISSHLDHF